jgi:formate dehydrogenase major subunit
MTTTDRPRDYDEADLSIEKPKTHAAGITAVAVSMKRSLERMGPTRTAKSLLKLNQAEGFDCMSCAWPDPDPGHRHAAEFCENGAKAVAEEATTRTATPELFAKHSIAELEQHSEYWLGQQGRITHPMVKRSGGTHYETIDWDDAFTMIGEQLKALEPDQATFYTSGRASNESAFVYQLFARAYGTNNLPDCSNMCHESTSFALQETIGIGKASVVLQDVYDADLIVLAGQNPGTNHPRMLSALEQAKHNGAKIIAINPLREAGLINFKNPQTPRGVVGPGTKIEDLHLPVRINGDLALFKAFGKLLVEWDALDHAFIDKHTNNFDLWKQHVSEVDWNEVETVTGLSRTQITEAARMLRDSKKTVFCWAMGITQHHNSVNTIKEIVNLALAQGNIGKPGAGLLPVRGHSNVQGDRTMGIWERVPKHFLDAIENEFGFDPPRENGLDTIDSIRGMRDGKVHFFLGLGGNFAQAAPDQNVTFDAMRKTKMTVHISTKINRSHLVTGDVALILPVKGRTEKDVQASGPQWISVEDSTCSVHSSRGPLDSPSPHAKSEVDIITRIAEATIGTRYGIDWKGMRDNYTNIRTHISRVVPGCESYEVNARRPGGFVLPHPPRDSRTFQTTSELAEFSVTPIDALHVPPKHLLLQTFRSHDQFNTTIYGLSDRYRGIEGGRRVIFLNRDDIAELGFDDGDLVDITTRWDDDDVERVAENFRIVEYKTPRGSAAAYYPETNVLVPLDSSATDSNCPTSKSIVVTLSPAKAGAAAKGRGGQDEMRSDESHKTQTRPEHLS